MAKFRKFFGVFTSQKISSRLNPAPPPITHFHSFLRNWNPASAMVPPSSLRYNSDFKPWRAHELAKGMERQRDKEPIKMDNPVTCPGCGAKFRAEKDLKLHLHCNPACKEDADDDTTQYVRAIAAGQHLQKWLTDEKARDQFVIQAGCETEVFWNDVRESRPDPVFKRSNWTKNAVQWSPLGTYLGVLHKKCAAVWGGATTFKQLMRFEHFKVQFFDFSPGEKFLVTYGGEEHSSPLHTRWVAIKIFEIRTGELMIDFEGRSDQFTNHGISLSWPVFRWSGGKEDKYFAGINKCGVVVYNMIGDMTEVDFLDALEFSWSPTDPILALFVSQPARVCLVQLPGEEELRQKQLFSVCKCKMHWQSNGDYLAVIVDHFTRRKKRTYSCLDIFRVKEHDLPVEVLQLEIRTDSVFAFGWEPNGARFAVIHGDKRRQDVSFYSMGSAQIAKLTTLKGRQANSVFWSPAGHFVILCGVQGVQGQLEVYDVDGLKTMSRFEHSNASHVEWDPTGRYVVTAVTSTHEMENSYRVWSVNGELLYSVPKRRLLQWSWRPRPYNSKDEADDVDVPTVEWK